MIAMSEHRVATAQLKYLIALIGILPFVGAILLILKFAFDAQLEPQGDPDLFGRRLQLLIHLLVPLSFGICLAGLGFLIRKPKLGIILGIAAIALVYVVMILNNERAVAECAKTYGMVCGEWSVVGYAFWGGMWLVDALALFGLGTWVIHRNKDKGN
jgi:hypothetical protein